ncbi:uncharacterized protein Pyn_26561 [Prunus yedoensis var. nudiflora]|uniref:Uncharacterized protein n=1 Tax=Prunus yedoensis var. nudiflora TaxID=2094558 RepID=A0A314Y418_PRUYE|nr:uncharacterized protein Pyn_26561 [Prunus yedoensis var. nudiflora]
MMMMEGIKGGGGGRVNGVGGHHDQVQVQDQDMGDGMQCSDHPYRNNPGGICAFCLQEKLGKLVSSSFPLPIHASASSSSSPSFRSDTVNVGVVHNGNGVAADDFYSTRRARISFLLAKKKKKVSTATSNAASSDRAAADVVFKRSKSTTTPRRAHHFLDGSEDFSPRKRGGFWSFLYHSSAKSSSSNSLNKKAIEKSKISSSSSFTSSAAPKDSKCLGSSSQRNKSEHLAVEAVAAADDDSASPNSSQATAASASSFERKVSRSRSVGCGSRSFSGDFFERISTGFGDCTLRRVESQREGKPKASVHRQGEHNNSHCMKERVKCGGIFSGFMMTSSSSSSSSSSYWVSSSAEGQLVHGRSRSWGWAFASPMRAFTKPSSSSKDGKRDIVRQASDKNTTPNLNAIPSLLSVRG